MRESATTDRVAAPNRNGSAGLEGVLPLDGHPAVIESPSLSTSADRSIPAYELKFLLTEPQAREVEARVRGLLDLDPHAEPELGNAYRTTSLYCDTAEFEVFHRLGAFKRRKHRLRRYDHAAWIYLERKSKWGERVQKRRTRIPDSELTLFPNPTLAMEWAGLWFHRHVVRRQLRPVCRIAYDRVAYMGFREQGPIRLTFDRQVRGVPTNDWQVDEFDGGVPLLTGQVICEFKFRGYLPALFKGIIQALQLSPSPVSKYRSFQRAVGFTAKRSSVDA